MTEYNATLAEAHEEPVLRIGSLVFRGRLLSIEDWLPFYERQVALEKENDEKKKAGQAPNIRAALELWVDYLRTIFPRRRFNWFAPDPVEWLRKHDTQLREAYYRFFFLQARALGWELAGQSTDGPSSSGSTPAGGAGKA